MCKVIVFLLGLLVVVLLFGCSCRRNSPISARLLFIRFAPLLVLVIDSR